MVFPDHLKTVGFYEHIRSSIVDLVGSPMLFQLFTDAKEWIDSHPYSANAMPAVPTQGDSPNSKVSSHSVCKFFERGNCRFGDKCRNHHPGSHLNQVKHEGDAKNSGNDISSAAPHEIKDTNRATASCNHVHQEADLKEENKKHPMRTASDVISRIMWDPDIETEAFTIGYLDRFVGIIEKPFSAFSWEDISSVDINVLAVPKHRIQYFKYKEEIVWDKRVQLDNVYGSRGGKIIQEVVEAYESKEKLTDDRDEEANRISGTEVVERSVKMQTREDRPTHFICIHITDEEVLTNARKIQDHAVGVSPHLSDGCLPQTALHVSVCMVQLETSSHLEVARKVLENTKRNFSHYLPKCAEVVFSGVDNFHDRLVYAKVAPNAALAKYSAFIIERFKRAGLKTPGNHSKFTPHMTLVKLSRPMQRDHYTTIINKEAYVQFKDMHIGKQSIDGVHLCSMTEPKQSDGFYKRFHFISNSLANLSPLLPLVFSKCVRNLQQNGAIHETVAAKLIVSAERGNDIISFDKSVGTIRQFVHNNANPLGSRVVLLRGLPGSGKSYLSRKCPSENSVICSADDYFTKSGRYDFNQASLPEAHAHCFETFLQALIDGKEVIVVDNTNSMRWEYRNYVYLCELLGVRYHILEIPHPNEQIVSVYCSRNLHKVDELSIKSFTERWEDDKRSMLVPPKIAYPTSTASKVSDISLLSLCQPGYLPKDVLTSHSTLIPVYVGIFLTPKSQWKLVSSITPTHPNIYADHITLMFEPSQYFINSTEIGKKVSITLNGLADTSTIQAVTVDLPKGFSSQNMIAHITISTEESSTPKLANSMLQSQTHHILSDRLKLNGVVGLVVKEAVSAEMESQSGGDFYTILSKKHFNDEVLPRLKNLPSEVVPSVDDESTSEYDISICTGVQKVTKLHIFDFDGTLFDTPDPAAGRQLYQELTGQRWPHGGWLSRPESLLPPLKIKPGPVLSDYRKHCGRVGSYTAVLTARIAQTEATVRMVLDDHQMHPDQLILKPGELKLANPEFKVSYLSKLLKQFPDVTLVKFWDDREDNLQAVKNFSKQPRNSKIEFGIINSTTATPTFGPRVCNSALGSYLAASGLLPTLEHVRAARSGIHFIASQFCTITGFQGDPTSITLIFGSHILGRKSDVDLCLLAPHEFTHSDCIEKLAAQLESCGITHIHKGYSSRCPRLKVMLHFKDTPSIDYDIVFATLSSLSHFPAHGQDFAFSNLEKLIGKDDSASRTSLSGHILLRKVQETIDNFISVESFGAIVEMTIRVLTAQREKADFYQYIRSFHVVLLLTDFIHSYKISHSATEIDSLFCQFITHTAQLTAERWHQIFEDYIPIKPEYIPRQSGVFKTLSLIVQQRDIPIAARYEEMMVRPVFPPSGYIPVWLLCTGNDPLLVWKLKTLLEAKLPTFIRQLASSGLDVVLDGNSIHSSFCFALQETKSTKDTLQITFRRFWNEFSEYRNQKDVRLELKFGRSTESEHPTEAVSGEGSSGYATRQKVEEFASGDMSELHLPSSLSSYERLLAHETAEKLGISHKTLGEGSKRHVYLYK